MKKILNLLVMAMITIAAFNVQSVNAQETPIWSEDFSALTASGTQQCGASGTAYTASTLGTVLPGWSCEKAYPANGKIKLGTSSINGWIETPSIDLSSYGTVRIVFDAKAWNTSNASQGTTMTVYVNSNAYTIEGLPNAGSTDTTTAGFCDMGTFEIMAAAGAPTVIRFEASPRAFIDNINIYASTGPAISVQGTTSFDNLGTNETATSNLIAKGFNLTAGSTTAVAIVGDTHFTTTTTTVANNDLLSENGVSIPVAFSADAAGSYAATLILTNSDLEDTVTVALSATVIDIVEISALDQLRALIDNSDVNANVTDSIFYKYTGHAYVSQTFQSGSYTKWIQDATGAIQLYDPDGHLSNVSLGQEITNVVGKLNNYYGYVEFNVQAGISNADINAFPTNVPEPIVVTLAQLQDVDYMGSIQGQLIKLENVSFSSTGQFTKFIRYEVSQNGSTDSSVYFTGSYDTQVGTNIPTGEGNIIGVNMFTAAYSAGYGTARLTPRYYILPRDFEGFNVGISENEMSSVNVFPNPTSSDVVLAINTPATHVAIYNMVGELVDSQAISTGDNTVKMSQLTNGVYFLRIFNGNELVGTSKVVRN